MREGVAAFYDPYVGPYAPDLRRWPRYLRRKRLLTKGVVLIALASLLLLVFVAADVNAYYSLPVKVTVTEIHWFVGNVSVGNASGFSVKGGQEFSENLVCTLFCPTFVGESVNSPFVLVNLTITYPWFEYANATFRAPNSAYTGPLDIVLRV